MNAKKARALRKSLSINKDKEAKMSVSNKVQKIGYIRDKNGQLTPTILEKTTLVNEDLKLYRQAKKDLKKDK
jgi:hypothetical protein